MGYRDLADPAEQLKQGLLGKVDPSIDVKHTALAMFHDFFMKSGRRLIDGSVTKGYEKAAEHLSTAFSEALEEGNRDEILSIIDSWMEDVKNDMRKKGIMD